MYDLIVGVFLFVIGSILILLVIYGGLHHPRLQGGISGYTPMIYCKNCNEPIHGCTHLSGVPSQYEHSGGYQRCRNGKGTTAAHP